MKKHAKLSPSSSHAWTSCTASPGAQEGIDNEDSDASRAGTVCHEIQEICLTTDADPSDFLGREMVFSHDKETGNRKTCWADELNGVINPEATEARVPVTDDMVRAVSAAVAFITEQHTLLGGQLLVEQRVPIGQFTGEPDAYGSADVILIGEGWVHVMDSKFGRKRVHAHRVIRQKQLDIITGEEIPEVRGPNLQMACYALGAIHEHGLFNEFRTVTMTIVQPFLDHTDSYTCSIEELRETEAFLAAKAYETRDNPQFAASYDNCLFCRAKGTCEAQARAALDGVLDMQPDGTAVPKPVGLPSLGSQYALLPFIEKWVKDVHAAVEAELRSGNPVVRDDGLSYKLVEGKNGARQWVDKDEAEAALKKMRLKHDQIYEYSLISPTTADKLAHPPKPKKGAEPVQPVLGKTQWSRLQTLIKQTKGKPQIALETDPRPAISNAEGFEDNSD